MNQQKNFTIHVSSCPTNQHPDNNASNFTATLPQTLHLRGHWKVALNQIILSSKMKMLPTLDLRLKIEDVESSQIVYGKFSSMSNDYKDLLDQFKDQVKTVADVAVLSTGNIVLKFKKPMKLTLGSHLAFLLGHIDPLKELNLSNVPSPIDVTQDVIPPLPWTLVRNNNFVFGHAPRPITLHPKSIFIYSKELEYSMVGNKKLPLLSIVTVPPTTFDSQHDGYQEVQVEDQTYIGITNTQLKSLEFNLRSHDDSLIQFSDPNAITYLGLIFQRQD